MLIASLPLSCLWRDAKHHIPAAGQGQALWVLPSKDPFVRRVSLLLLRWFSGVSSKCQSYCAPCDYQVYLWEIRTVPNWNSVPYSLLTVGRSDILWNFDGKQKLIVDVMTIEEHDSSFVITAGGALFDWWVTDLRCDNAWPDNKYIVFGDKPSTLCMLRGTRNRHSHLKWLVWWSHRFRHRSSSRRQSSVRPDKAPLPTKTATKSVQQQPTTYVLTWFFEIQFKRGKSQPSDGFFCEKLSHSRFCHIN